MLDNVSEQSLFLSHIIFCDTRNEVLHFVIIFFTFILYDLGASGYLNEETSMEYKRSVDDAAEAIANPAPETVGDHSGANAGAHGAAASGHDAPAASGHEEAAPAKH